MSAPTAADRCINCGNRRDQPGACMVPGPDSVPEPAGEHQYADANGLTESDYALLEEALDSHMYWQLAEQDQRNDGHVIFDEGDDNAEELSECEALAARLARLREKAA